MNEEKQSKIQKAHDQQYAQWQELSKAHWSHWRAWGSWFSWGSPVGLGLGYALIAVSTGVFIWLTRL